jgi:hypothetical protein
MLRNARIEHNATAKTATTIVIGRLIAKMTNHMPGSFLL